jgi:hypothetical protein
MEGGMDMPSLAAAPQVGARPLEVAPLGGGLYRVRSEMHPGIWYDVALDPSGTGWCSCPDHEYRRRECKHIRAARRAALAIPEREEVAADAQRS